VNTATAHGVRRDMLKTDSLLSRSAALPLLGGGIALVLAVSPRMPPQYMQKDAARTCAIFRDGGDTQPFGVTYGTRRVWSFDCLLSGAAQFIALEDRCKHCKPERRR
jgi:hypothetical protein